MPRYLNELSVINDIVFKREKILIPPSLSTDMLSRVHTGHMGMEKCKQRAHDILFWPGMNKEIANMV